MAERCQQNVRNYDDGDVALGCMYGDAGGGGGGGQWVAGGHLLA